APAAAHGRPRQRQRRPGHDARPAGEPGTDPGGDCGRPGAGVPGHLRWLRGVRPRHRPGTPARAALHPPLRGLRPPAPGRGPARLTFSSLAPLAVRLPRPMATYSSGTPLLTFLPRPGASLPPG